MSTPVKHILEHFFNEQERWQFQLLRAWPQIIKQLNTKVRILKITQDTLVLGVQDSCWLQEMYLLSGLLLNTINQHLDQPRIKQLRFRLYGSTTHHPARITPPRSSPAPVVNLPARTVLALERISDESLRAHLKQYLVRCHQTRSLG